MAVLEEDIALLKEMQFNSSMLRSYYDPKAERKSLAIRNVLARIKELEDNEKVITKMAEYIEDKALDDICRKKDCYSDEYINGHCPKCVKCVIEHFRKEV